jgi:beta-glucosidase
MRPVKELKAFRKVFLKAGESRTVELTLPARSLGFYDETTKDWKLEAGNYLLSTAASSADLKGSVKVEIQ